MRQMKDSGVKWIENIPSDWTIVPLKWIVKFGKGLPITKDNLVEQGVPVVSYGQIHSKTNSGTHLGKDLMRFVNEKYLQSNPSSLGKKGDIFFADTSEDYAGVGNAVLVDGDEPVFAGYHTVIVRPIDLLYSKYLAYLFLTDAWRSQLCSRVSGIKVFSVTQGLLKETTVILPPTEKIATMTDYLDRKCSQIDAIIAKQQQIIEKLKEYKLSVITEAVTKGLDPNVPMKDSGVEWIGKVPEHWKVPKIKYLATIASGGTPDRSHPEYWNGSINWAKTGELQNSELYETEEKITELALENSSAKVFAVDTILVAMYGQGKTRGMTALLKIPSATNQACAGITIYSKDITVSYLWLFLMGAYDAIREKANGSGQPNLSGALIADFNVTLPPVEEQINICKTIAMHLPHIDSIIKQKEAMIDRLVAYKKSLIYEVVTGKKEVKF